MATSEELLNVISSQVVDYLGKSKAAEVTTISNAQKAQVITAESEAALRQVAQDQAAIVRQQQTAELQAQNIRRSAALAAGVNPDTGAGTILDLISTIRTTIDATKPVLEQYNKEQTTRLIDDPLTWIKAQVDWDNTGAKLQAGVRTLEIADKQLGAVNGALQQSARTAETLKESVTAATIDASARVAGTDAMLRAQQAAIEGLKFNATEVQAAATGSRERLDALYNVLGSQRQEEQMRMALENFNLQKEKFNWEKEERALAREAKNAGKLADDLSLSYINQSLASFGQPTINAQEAATQLQLFKSGASKDLAYHYQNGRRIAVTGVSMLGSTPAEAVAVLSEIPSSLPTARAEVAVILAQAKAALDSSKRPDLADEKGNQGKRAAFINQTVNEMIAQMSAAIVPNSSNLFDVGDLRSYLGDGKTTGISQLQNLPFTTKLLRPAIEAGQPLNDPKLIMGLTIESVKRGDLTSTEAIDGLTQVYRRANEINQAARGFTGFGIVPPANGKTYNAQLGAFGRTVNLTDPVAVSRYLSTELAQSKFNDYRMSGGLREPITKALSGVPTSFGPEITNTPEKYAEGTKRLSDYLKQGGK